MWWSFSIMGLITGMPDKWSLTNEVEIKQNQVGNCILILCWPSDVLRAIILIYIYVFFSSSSRCVHPAIPQPHLLISQMLLLCFPSSGLQRIFRAATAPSRPWPVLLRVASVPSGLLHLPTINQPGYLLHRPLVTTSTITSTISSPCGLLSLSKGPPSRKQWRQWMARDKTYCFRMGEKLGEMILQIQGGHWGRDGGVFFLKIALEYFIVVRIFFHFFSFLNCGEVTPHSLWSSFSPPSSTSFRRVNNWSFLFF